MSETSRLESNPARPTKRRPARVIRVENGASYGPYSEHGPQAPFLLIWRYQQLLRRLVQRDVEQRFLGSILGKGWAVISPLIMLTIYTVSFGLIIQPQWQKSVSSPAEVALIYFTGLIVFDFFFEGVNRGPSLIIDHVGYIKKIVFPLEIVAWVVLGSACFRLLIGVVLASVFYLAIKGAPPINIVIIPLLFALLSMFAVGFVWLLSCLAVFVRDIRHLIMVLMPTFMFLTPVFFPLSAAPETAQRLLYINPLTFPLEATRSALFHGQWPSLWSLAIYAMIGWLFCWCCYRIFMKLRAEFADVL